LKPRFAKNGKPIANAAEIVVQSRVSLGCADALKYRKRKSAV
jgi:hypothetical protein